MLRPKSCAVFTLLLLNAFPSLAEAAKAGAYAAGERVLVNGRLHRKCSAKIEAIPSPGFARLSFDRAGCGDASVAYDFRQLQHISYVSRYSGIAEGDAVVVKGHFDNDCGGRVHEISRSGYASVDLDSLLCADTMGLFRARDLHKVEFVKEASSFAVGQKISTRGIHEGDVCRGEIRRITDNGLAEITFEELTCAYGGKLYSLDDLRAVKPAVRKHASGEMIFQQVMREIASKKKTSRRISRAP